MDKIKVGKIPYLNCALFYHKLENRDDIALPPLVPSALSVAAGTEAVDAGPVPVVTCATIADRYEPLRDFCIATTHDAHSILFFSKVPVDQLDGKVVGVTYQTSTSVRLMKVLLSQRYRVRPAEYVTANEPNDATLLIGDDALRHRRGLKGYDYRYDLGRTWREWLDLPFMFARWMVRTDLDPALKQKLGDELAAALDEGWERFDDVVAPGAEAVGMTIDEARDYLEGFHFRAGDEEERSVTRFLELDRAAREDQSAEPAGKGD